MEERPNTQDYLNKAEAEVERLREILASGPSRWIVAAAAFVAGLLVGLML